MGLLNQLLQCEFSYCQLLSKREDSQGVIKFSDKSNLDLPMQNYIYITRDLPPKEFGPVIRDQEKQLDKDATFIKFVFDPYQPYPGDIPELEGYKYNKTLLLIYDLRNSMLLDNGALNCYSRPVFSDYLQLEKGLLSDKSLAHIEKWYNLSLDRDDLEILTYKNGSDSTGRCDLYYYKNLAKIEDLEVLFKERGKGGGKALIDHSIYLAGKENKNFIYLLCDSELGDYYIERGFTLYSEFNTFIKYY